MKFKYLVVALLSLGGALSGIAEIETIEGQKHFRFGDSVFLIEDGQYLKDGQASEILAAALHRYASGNNEYFKPLVDLWTTLPHVYKGELLPDILLVCLKAQIESCCQSLDSCEDDVYYPSNGNRTLRSLVVWYSGNGNEKEFLMYGVSSLFGRQIVDMKIRRDFVVYRWGGVILCCNVRLSGPAVVDISKPSPFLLEEMLMEFFEKVPTVAHQRMQPKLTELISKTCDLIITSKGHLSVSLRQSLIRVLTEEAYPYLSPESNQILASVCRKYGVAAPLPVSNAPRL